MEDHQIVELFWQRDEAAIGETADKYGRYLYRIAHQILSEEQDSQEVVNDTYLGAWDSMPDNRPTVLSTYLGKITRRTAIDRYRQRTSAKREASQYAQSLEELSQCVSEDAAVFLSGGSLETPESVVTVKELNQVISDWLWQQPKEMRHVFLWRYFYMDPIRDIASRNRCSESKIKSILHRMRRSLRVYLEKEGYHL